jgi:serine/threonine-protein kinase PRP4
MRSDEILIRAGEREKEFLKQLNMTDKQDKKNIIRMVDSFEHKKHLCLVFELM